MEHRPPGGCPECAALYRRRLAVGDRPRRARRRGGRVLRLRGWAWRGHGAGREPLSGGRRLCRPDRIRRAVFADDRTGQAARGSAEPLASAARQYELTMLAELEEPAMSPGLRFAAIVKPCSG